MTDKPTTGDPTPLSPMTRLEEQYLRADIAAGHTKTGHAWRWIVPRLLATLDAERKARPVPAGEPLVRDRARGALYVDDLAVPAGDERNAAEHDAGTCPTCGRAACVGRLDYEHCRFSVSPSPRENRHALLMPPHPGEVYATSALCSCGEFQYDADSPGDLTNRYLDVLRQHAAHRLSPGGDRCYCEPHAKHGHPVDRA